MMTSTIVSLGRVEYGGKIYPLQQAFISSLADLEIVAAPTSGRIVIASIVFGNSAGVAASVQFDLRSGGAGGTQLLPGQSFQGANNGDAVSRKFDGPILCDVMQNLVFNVTSGGTAISTFVQYIVADA